MSVDNLESFAGRPVADYDPAQGIADPAGTAYRVRAEYGAGDLPTLLQQLLSDSKAAALQALVIGMWGEEYDTNSSGVVTQLVQSAAKLPGLEALFVGDMCGEEFEISWIQQSDLGPLLRAFPGLKHFGARGGEGLAFSGPILHEGLVSLRVETGGLPGSALRQIAAMQLPALEDLELWLGEGNYGWSGSVDDLAPILSGKAFPKLRRLGLMNSEVQDAVARAVAGAPILEQLDELDLSMGTLGDAGAEALLAAPALSKLQRLNLDHHYMSDAVVARLEALDVDVSHEPNDEEPYEEGDRYVEVGE